MNDLPEIFNNQQVNLYADDTAITVTSDSVFGLEISLNETLSTLKRWFDCNKLSMNCTKSKVMLIGTSNQRQKMSNITVKCGDIELEKVEEYKYLGVMIDHDLNFKSNTDYIASKVLKRLGILGRASVFLPESTTLYLYKELILPILDYADFIYDGTYQYNKHVLQILQNNALRLILKAPKLTSTESMHNE